MKCSGKVKVYQLFNMDVDRWGTPFVRCEAHAKKQKVPDGCILQAIRMVCEVQQNLEPKAAATRRFRVRCTASS